MAAPSFDVVGIGNAIVDVLARADDAFLAAQGLVKGTMALIDARRAESLYALDGRRGSRCRAARPPTPSPASPRSAARRGYIGKVADDQLGSVFAHDLRAIGVALRHAALEGRARAPARCLILVTPDAQRTMNTFLGASRRVRGPSDIDRSRIAAAQVTYLEGYLFDPPHRQGGVPRRRRDRPQGRAQGQPVAVRPVLRRAPPRRFPRPRASPHRHPVRQRDRDLLALRDQGFR